MHWAEKGFAPAMLDVARSLNVTAPGVQHAFKKLKDLGFIDYTKGISRSVRILDKGRLFLEGKPIGYL